ncbi:MAG: hypothetical protein K0V04_07725 [Deltaproteobacteria bacterium]|nr:hypothetical protein [Deltaproteobacteria bacterium]
MKSRENPQAKLRRSVAALMLAVFAPMLAATTSGCDDIAHESESLKNTAPFRTIEITSDDIDQLQPSEMLSLDLSLEVIYRIDESVSVSDRARLVLTDGENEEYFADLMSQEEAIEQGYTDEGSFLLTGDPRGFGTLTEIEIEQLEEGAILQKEAQFRSEVAGTYSCLNLLIFQKYKCVES